MILKKSTYVDIGIDFASQGNYDIDIENEIKKNWYWYWNQNIDIEQLW